MKKLEIDLSGNKEAEFLDPALGWISVKRDDTGLYLAKVHAWGWGMTPGKALGVLKREMKRTAKLARKRK